MALTYSPSLPTGFLQGDNNSIVKDTTGQYAALKSAYEQQLRPGGISSMPTPSLSLASAPTPAAFSIPNVAGLLQTSQYQSAAPGTIFRDVAGSQYYKTSGGGLSSISSPSALQELASSGIVRPGSDTYFRIGDASAPLPTPTATMEQANDPQNWVNGKYAGPSPAGGTNPPLPIQPGERESLINLYTSNGYAPADAAKRVDELLADRMGPSPMAETANQAPTQPFSFDLPSELPSDLSTGSPKTFADIAALLAQQQAMQGEYLAALQPGKQEQDLQQQLIDLRAKAEQTQLNLRAGITDVQDQPVPMPVIVGQSASLERRANLQLQNLSRQESNLVGRLNIAQTNRTTLAEGLANTVNWGFQSVNTLVNLQQAAAQQEQQVFDRAMKMRTESRDMLTTILDKFKGLDFSDLDATTQAKLSNLAARGGIPADVLMQGMKTVKSQQMLADYEKNLDIALKEQKLGTGGAQANIDNFAKTVLDGRLNLASVPEDLRGAVNDRMRSLMEGGYKSAYPELTPAQVEGMNVLTQKLQNDPLYRQMLDVLSAYQSVGTGNKQNNGFGDLMMINGLQRMVDPGSVVREGQFKTVEDAQAWLQRVLNISGRVIEGTRLSPTSRQELYKAASDLYKEKAQLYNNFRGTQFKQQAAAANVPWNLIGEDFPLDPSLVSGSSSRVLPQDDKSLDQLYNSSTGPVYGPPAPPVRIEDKKVSITIPPSSNIAYTNNNPGNLTWANQPGAVQNGRWAHFTTPAAGLRALLGQIDTDVGRGHTLQSFITKYAPPFENDTRTYVTQAAKSLGVNPNTKLSAVDRWKLARFLALKESSTMLNFG